MKQSLVALGKFFKRDLSELHWRDYCALPVKIRVILLFALLLFLSFIIFNWTPLGIDFDQRSELRQTQQQYQRQLALLKVFRDQQSLVLDSAPFEEVKQRIEKQLKKLHEIEDLEDGIYQVLTKNGLEILSFTPTYERKEWGEGWYIQLSLCGDESQLLNGIVSLMYRYPRYLPEVGAWRSKSDRESCTANRTLSKELNIQLRFYDIFTLEPSLINQNFSLLSEWHPTKARDIVKQLQSDKITLDQWGKRLSQNFLPFALKEAGEQPISPFVVSYDLNKEQYQHPADEAVMRWGIGEYYQGTQFLGFIKVKGKEAEAFTNSSVTKGVTKGRIKALFRIKNGSIMEVNLDLLEVGSVVVDFYRDQLLLFDRHLIELLRDGENLNK